jgi:hypothetical protein
MGILGSFKRSTGMSGPQKALKSLDKDIVGLTREFNSGKFTTEDQMREEAERLIDKHSGGNLTREEVAFATVWGLARKMTDNMTNLHEPSNETLRYYVAAFQAILELASEYHTDQIAGDHRPHIIGYALYYLDIEISQNASKSRMTYAKDYKKAKENGDKEQMQKYEQIIEKKLQEQMQKNLDKVKSWKEKTEKQLNKR